MLADWEYVDADISSRQNEINNAFDNFSGLLAMILLFVCLMLPNIRKTNNHAKLDTGCWILDAGYWMLDTGCWILDTGYWILDA
jgi:hypothetical protein